MNRRSTRAPALRDVHVEIPAPAARAISLAAVASAARRAGILGHPLRYTAFRERGGGVCYRVAATRPMARQLARLFTRRALDGNDCTSLACDRAARILTDALLHGGTPQISSDTDGRQRPVEHAL